jgi:hypothetical protein
LGNGHFAKIATGDSLELQNEVIKTLEKLKNPAVITPGSPEEQDLKRIESHVTENPNWSYPP